MINIRLAAAPENQLLADIAFKSEAHWGYETDYMERFRAIYKVTEDFIKYNPTYVIEEYDGIIGFYGLSRNYKEISLEYFFIEPQSIGKGYGKLLWNHLVDTCKYLGIEQFSIVTSPQAKDFYLKLGAESLGEVESLLKKGRMIPRLFYTVK